MAVRVVRISIRSLIDGLLAAGLICTNPSALAAGVAQRIDSVQERLLPPVLVDGESPRTATLAARMAALHVSGVSIAVIHGRKIEWARGFGVARLGGPKVSPATLFQAASISKPVSALGVLRLVQDGRLDLDTDINRYLRSWKLPEGEFTRAAKITLRGVLSHTAGVSVQGFRGYGVDDELPTLVQILNGESPANSAPLLVEFAPGTAWRYSGGGYVIAQQALIDVTGRPFPVLMKERVLGPLGMKHSTYESPLPARLRGAAAAAYRGDGHPVEGGAHTYPEFAAASLWSTPSDLARYAIAVQKALSGRSRILSGSLAREMLKPGMNHHGLGPSIGGTAPNLFFTHAGANEGFRCQFVAYESGDGAVIMTNSDNGDALIPEVLRTIAHEYGWPDFGPARRTVSAVEPRTFDRNIGAFRMPWGAVVTFWRDGARTYSRYWGRPVVELFPLAPEGYFDKNADTRWEFESAGKPDESQGVTLFENGQQIVASRIAGGEGAAELEQSMEAQRRFVEQRNAATSEIAMRRFITGIVGGSPPYDAMSKNLADWVRAMPQEMRSSVVRLGDIESTSFASVGPLGEDNYEVRFAAGVRGFKILMLRDGRIDKAWFSHDP